jgi:glycosyltransferase involved in cell wall biosynthesis
MTKVDFQDRITGDIKKIIDNRLPELPQLTIAVCCYEQNIFVTESLNRAHELLKLLPCELLFIDDGSTDYSFDTAVTWQDNTHTPALLITKTNRGLVDSLNMALKLARAPYVFFIAADDLICSNALHSIYKTLAVNPRMGFAMGNCMCFGENFKKRPAYGNRHDKFLKSPAIKRPTSLPSKLPGPMLIQATLFRTVFLRQNGGWNSGIRLDDMQLFVHLFSMEPEHGLDFIYEHDLYISEYRQHKNNNYRRLLHQFSIYEEFIRKAISEHEQPTEYAFALAMYLIQALITRNLEALKFLSSFAFHKRIVLLTLYEIQKRVIGKFLMKFR